jgi:uncharacterized protein YecE (DUF72 family)
LDKKPPEPAAAFAASLPMMRFIGTAGWNIPARYKEEFPAGGSHLERYAAKLNCAEINSSFYRPHQRKTYERWAASVPQGFPFSVKVPRTITQTHRLQDCGDLLTRFAEQVSGLGDRLGVLLVQLPPSLVYDAEVAAAFFHALRKLSPAEIACEPRHASWFAPPADAALAKLKVARVAADPPRDAADGAPGGWRGLAYWRLHGSPKIYYSDYPDAALRKIASKLAPNDWCIFDNTAAFAALGNALALQRLADG